jgi:hypothetical protein
MAGEDVREFLDAIDAELARRAEPGETLDLYLLGGSALILGYQRDRATVDVDVVHIHDSRLLDIAVERFGRDSPKRLAGDFYLETVSSGLPPLPAGFEKRCIDVPGAWKVIRPKYLEPHDLITTKLRRFNARDREDVRFLCDTSEVDADELQMRFDIAHQFSDLDDPHVVAASENLRRVLDYLNGLSKTL